jgi:hypothetical protein
MRSRFLLLTTIGVATLTGREAQSQGTHIGAYLGSSIASISYADEALRGLGAAAVNRERRVGVQAGVWLTRPLVGALSLQPEVHYTQKGVRLTSSIGAGFDVAQGNVALDLAYLEVPLLLRLALGGVGGVRPFLLAGPAVAWQSGCRVGAKANGIGVTFKCEDAADTAGESGYRSYDTSAIVGGGLAVRVGGREYSAGMRYTAGLASIAEGEARPRNGNLSVLLGLGF